MAEDNIAKTFPEFRSKEIHALALENFRRIGEAYACAIRTPGMDPRELLARIEFVGLEDLLQSGADRLVVATGHFGGFDLLAHVQGHWPNWRLATTYRAQRFTALNTTLQRLRSLTGVQFIERHESTRAIHRFFDQNQSILALFSDQHGGGKGLWLPFLGHRCSCSPAPAVIALRYKALLTMAICYRTDLARWRIEVGPVIPTHDEHGEERSLEDITLEIHRQYDIAVRRDPANWFWVHRRWKPPTANQRTHDQAPGPSS